MKKKISMLGDIALITPFIPLILRGIVRESTLILRGRLKKSPCPRQG
jgi:hypothetical protein